MSLVISRDISEIIQGLITKYEETGVINAEEVLFLYDTIVKSESKPDLTRFNQFAALVAGEYYRKKLQHLDILRKDYYDFIREDVFLGDFYAKD